MVHGLLTTVGTEGRGLIPIVYTIDTQTGNLVRKATLSPAIQICYMGF